MTTVVGPDDLAVGDHVTIYYRKPDMAVRKAHSVPHDGVVRKISEGGTMVLLSPEGGSEADERWVYIDDGHFFDVVIERHRREWVEGGDYLVRHESDHPNVVRIWRRERTGWRTTSGFRPDGHEATEIRWEIGPRVLITVADR